MSGQTHKIKWTREATRHLIHLYRDEPCLWDAKNPEYKERDTRVKALQEIADHINSNKKIADYLNRIDSSFSIEDVKKKIDTLRNQHRREMRQLQQSIKSGAGASDGYVPRLWCFDALAFLIEDEDPRASGTKLEYVHDDTMVDDYSDIELYNEPFLNDISPDTAMSVNPSCSFQDIPPPSVMATTEYTSRPKRPPKPNKKIRKRVKTVRKNTQVFLQEAVQQLRVMSSVEEMKDVYNNFGHIVAHDLRQMSDEGRIYAQRYITEILFLGKLGKLSASTMIVE